jgi:hypothetical protein
MNHRILIRSSENNTRERESERKRWREGSREKEGEREQDSIYLFLSLMDVLIGEERRKRHSHGHDRIHKFGNSREGSKPPNRL